MADAYGHAVSRLICAQLARKAGFDTSEQRALNIIASLLQQFLEMLGTTAKANAELCGRTESNLVDLLDSFAELGICVPDLRRHFIRMVEDEDYEPTHTSPPFPRPAPPPLDVNFDEYREYREAPPPSIPRYLPLLPPVHTYKHTPAPPNRFNPGTIMRLRVYIRRDIESALTRLSKNEAFAAAEEPPPEPQLTPPPQSFSGSANPYLAAAGASENPYLAATASSDNPYLAAASAAENPYLAAAAATTIPAGGESGLYTMGGVSDGGTSSTTDYLTMMAVPEVTVARPGSHTPEAGGTTTPSTEQQPSQQPNTAQDDDSMPSFEFG
ncbi:putative transcription initiation factor TFIID subunit 8 [Paratrimastix pyriformis]|uniref:Transcription initiation factor TFIID subunit 8 n=1 Tax=Paratrimastix pyriformis TaxID=342808 RepID=A0ABQ8USW1_9EUKA|nr:putative transcription initiation factor TFIID subunit 8 [Paratrimastix pyriformis]